MQNQNNSTDQKSEGAYMPNEKFANWDKNSSQKESNMPGMRNKKKKNEFPKDAKNRINPAASNFVNEGNPNTDQKIKKVQEEGQRLERQQDEPAKSQNSWDQKSAESNQQFHRDQLAARNQHNPSQTDHQSQRQDSFADQQLALDIQAAIEKEESIAADDKSNVQVSVEHGTVTLSGTVFSDQQKRTLGDKAVAFAGIGKVHNELEVRETTELG